MTYRDMTFCEKQFCSNTECRRNWFQIEEAQKEGGFLHKNPWMPIATFVGAPVGCTKRISRDN